MVYSVQQIKYDVLAYIKEFGGKFDDWFIGISDNPKHALSNYHQVEQEQDIWLCKQALTAHAARTVQSFFLKLHTDGRVESSAEEPDYVYAYKKSERTNPGIQ